LERISAAIQANLGLDCPHRAVALVHRRRIELVLDALEMVEPLDRVVEFRAFFLGKLGLSIIPLVL
jgi:hypothetical protein